jgi:hypothetical protein
MRHKDNQGWAPLGFFTSRGYGHEQEQLEMPGRVAMGSHKFETNPRCRGHAGAVEHALFLDISCWTQEGTGICVGGTRTPGTEAAIAVAPGVSAAESDRAEDG